MPATVAIKSRVSGAVVDHFYHQSIAAFDGVTLIRERQWHRVPVDDGYVEFPNDKTGKLLGASLGRHAQAYATGKDGACRVQWKEIDTGDGHFLLQNRATGGLLCFEDAACVKLTPSTPEARLDHATHWCFVWLSKPPRDSMVAIRSVSSGNVLDHYYDKSVAALEADTHGDERRWHRIPVEAGFVVYRTVKSGKLLTHFKGHRIVTEGTEIDDPHAQWKEIPVADGQFALENRATRALLRNGSGVSIVAVTSGENGLLDSQNWWSFLSIEGTPKLPVWTRDAIVALKNRESDTLLEHHCGEHIAAYDDDTDHPNSQWYRVHVGGGFVSYKNVATGQVLQHFREEIIIVGAYDAATPSEACQWKEIDLGGGFFALQNRRTQALLRFECRDWTTAVIDELSGGRSDYLSQWSFVDVRAATKP